MKIIVTNNRRFSHNNNNPNRSLLGVSDPKTAQLIGMSKAYQKLKSRILREGLFSIGYAGYEQSKTEHGFFSINRN